MDEIRTKLFDKLIKYQTDRLLNQFEGNFQKNLHRLLTLPASHSTAAGTQSEDLTVTVHFPGIQFQFDLFGQQKDCISHQCLLSRKKRNFMQ